MAVAVDAVVSANANGVTSMNIGPLTTSGPERLLVLAHHLSDETKSISSIVGGGLSFTSLISLDMGAGSGQVDVWVAWARSTVSATTYTITYNSGFPQTAAVLASYSGVKPSLTGVTSVGATTTLDTAGPATSVSNNLTTTRNNSLVICAFGMTGNNAMTVGSNQAEDAETASVGGFSRLMLSRRDAVTGSEATSVTSNCTFASSTNIGTIQIELLVADALHNLGFGVNKLRPRVFSPGLAR